MKQDPVEFDETELDLAVSNIMSQPFDQAAEKRVILKALQIPHSVHSSDVAPNTESQRLIVRAQCLTRSNWYRAGGIAASLAASLLLLAWLLSGTTSTAFAQVVKHVMQIRSLRFDFALSHHDQPDSNGTMMIRDDIVRVEQFIGDASIVLLINPKKREALILDATRKLAQKESLEDVKGIANVNPIEELIAAESKSVKSLGKDVIQGKQVKIFRIRGLNVLGISSNTDMTLWVDEATQLPVKLEMLNADPKYKTRMTFDKFEWNVDLPESRFAMTVPLGYQEGSILVKPTRGSDKPPATDQDWSNGILFSGRVPARIAVDDKRNALTALIRDPENSQSHFSNELRQWDLATGQQRWQAAVGGAGDMAVCLDKDLLAVVQGQEIQLRRLSTGEILKTWASEHILGVLAFNFDGSRLAHGYTHWSRSAPKTATGGVEIWNVESGKLEQQIKELDRVEAVAFSPSGKSLMVDTGVTSRLFDSTTGELEYVIDSITSTFSPDGKWIALASREPGSNKLQAVVELMNVETKVRTKKLLALEGPTNSWVLSLKFSTDGKRLAASDWNGSVSIWDIESGKLLSGSRVLSGGVHSATFTKSNQIAVGCEAASLHLWSTD